MITAGPRAGHLWSSTSAISSREDHRYVFTLIHKFRTKDDETQMPVLSDRSDVIVITDEAHRSQYDTLALNMRNALPNASFLGFTGTPLISGEEQRTHEVFGEYVSTYTSATRSRTARRSRCSTRTGFPSSRSSTIDFSDELNEILEEAELDENAGAGARRGAFPASTS